MRKPQKVVVGVVGVLGRILICTVFLAAALGYTASDANSLAETIAVKTTVAPLWVLVGAILLLVSGILSVVVGYKARFGASALLMFLVLTTYCFHGFTFWNVVNPHARHEHTLPCHEPVNHGGDALHRCQWGRPDEPRWQAAVRRKRRR